MKMMASYVRKSVGCTRSSSSTTCAWNLYYRLYAKAAAPMREKEGKVVGTTTTTSASAPEILQEQDDITSGISRPLSQILKELNKKVPDSLVRVRTEPNGFPIKYIPWHIVNRIMNLHAPEWSGEVRSITYSADGNSVSVVYRVTLYGTDAEIYRESTGTASVNEGGSYGDPVQKAEAMAFRRACARLGLGLHLYHEDML
ncbi:DNA repair RAD52-like protein 1, mitochondrial isoform X1 [Actinidia eriantha]|uniref:DNA repair RAD52-like protein 1, mitochondrial isoform X1 n=1 Tax=Actinidia eriantha TaxID=165200 RepID=UPI002589E3B8|nr:DNA repair RAD52-like protein 1, mitochondrial isoform X1 [Actinidia eriantha]